MSLLIKGGDVVDGSGGAPFKADVLLVSDRIAAIGDLPAYKADKVINATGSFIIPAPIDAVSFVDRTALAAVPDFSVFEKEGMGTVLFGNRGVSRFPSPYGEPEPSWRFEGYPNRNSDWKDSEGFLRAVLFSKPHISFGSFVGWESLRGGVTEKWRELSDSEISVIAYSLSQSIAGGACGLSFESCSLSDIPISEKEFSALMRVLSEGRASCIFYLRSDSDYKEAAGAVKKVGEFGIPIIIAISPSVPLKNLKKLIAEIKEIPKEARVGIAFSPSGSELISIRDLLPADMRNLSEGLIAKEMQGVRMKTRIAKSISGLSLSKASIAFSPKASFLKGKLVSEFIDNRELSEDRIIPELLSVAGTNTFIRFPNEIVSDIVSEGMSFAASFGCPESHIANVFDCCDKADISISSAVRKMSAFPAEICGLDKRGKISEGNAASIVIVKDKKPFYSIIEGSVSISEGEVIGGHSGKLAKRHV